MLRECKVAPFSKWEKELPKFVSDPRFQCIKYLIVYYFSFSSFITNLLFVYQSVYFLFVVIKIII